MKKSFFTAAGLMLFALAFSSCQKEPVESAPAVSEPNFTLFAQPSSATKTTNDGLETKWAEGDAINVFHAAAGTTTYVSDGQFSLKDTESGKFDGTVSGLDADASYDWYAFYPYISQITTPANKSGYATVGGTSQTQKGNDSMAHISGKACPLYGVAKGVAYDETPSIEMNHLASVIKVNVTNNSGDDLTVSSIAFTGTEDIVGTYYINFAASPVTYTSSGNDYVSETATLTVNNGEAIENGSSSSFYIAIKPFTAKSGSTLKLSVNGYEKNITLPSDVTFTAGHIRTLGFNFDKTDKTAFFNFADPESLGITKPATSKGTNITAPIVKGDVTITATDGSTETRVFNSNNKCDLRVYKEGSLKFSAADGYIVNSIVLTSSKTITDSSISVDCGTYTSNVWNGESQSVEFSVSATVQISSVTVTYKKGVILPELAKPSIYADINSTKDGIEVTWGDVENATKYVVSCTGQADVEVAPGEEYASFAGLIVGQEYTVTVTASAEGYKSATSDEVKLTIPDSRTPLATPAVDAEVTEVNSIYVTWQAVSGAKDYTVTCGDQTVTTSETEYTFTGLAYSTEYTVSVVANPTDDTVNAESAPGTATVTTGANPSGETIVTYQHIFESKPSTGSVSLSGVDWTLAATNLGNYNSGNYAGVQFGTSKKSGSITLTSAAWSYKEKSKIKEVRIWLNAGSDVPTAAVTIGGKDAKSDGKIVQKNSSAKTYKDATMLTFTPVDGGDSGIVVINASTSSKAAYICAMEIDCF